jgi:RNA polymerase sigma-70 factor (ECF subfamily)
VVCDDAAREELVRSHWRRVYGFCYRFTGKDSDAQDLTQEVFVRVFRESAGDPFLVWLTRLTRDLLIEHYRRTRDDPAPDAGEPFQSALGRLSPELREAVILRDLQAMGYAEIADVLGTPEVTVKSRLSNGRAELGRFLRRAQDQA